MNAHMPVATPWLKSWLKTRLTFSPFSQTLYFEVPHDVFSTQQIDEGTTLLLNHLPPRSPLEVLDMGCGYGALSLPIAAHFPTANFDLVDRDLLAVDFSNRNSVINQLKNIHAFGSLGFLQVPEKKYDWILCNMPARIGAPFMEDFFRQGLTRLSKTGEIRVVVIHDLCPIIEAIPLPIRLIAKGEKHSIYALLFQDKNEYEPISTEALYLRDTVQFQGIEYLRPFDLGGDDPKRLKSGLPVLLDGFPRQHAADARLKLLSFRSGYGIAPIIAAKRWPAAHIFTWDRDLLAREFTNLNRQRHSVSAFTSLTENELDQHAPYDFIFGELSPSAGADVAAHEVQWIAKNLTQKGTGLILCFEKSVPTLPHIRIERILSRDGYVLLRVAP